MSTDQRVLTDRHEAVLTVTLNNPPRLNALTTATYEALGDAMRTAERDAAVRAVVLTGAGDAFSSGADVTRFNAASDETPDVGSHLRSGLNPLVLRMRGLEKPIVAAVNGVAAGAG